MAGRRPSDSTREGVEVTRLQVGEARYALISWPLPAEGGSEGDLTPAEREVITLALEGLSNQEIARRRRTSAGTVANQLASVYRKLGVGSRGGLSAWAARAGGRRTPR